MQTELHEEEFPIEVFEDVKPQEFSKHNKKHVSEDFVTENFNEIGWDVFRPFVDTGIDLIATRFVCPSGHTKWNQIYEQNQTVCTNTDCKKTLIRITRYIQIKTREIKGNESSSFFGYTLTSKDFRTDPRHVFLFYSDHSNDFIIVPVYEYLKIFHQNIETMGKSHFMIPSFRQNNNKLNSLRIGPNGWSWKPRGSLEVSFNQFVNSRGIKTIMKPDYEIRLEEFLVEIAKMKEDLLLTYSKGRQTTAENEKIINEFIKKRLSKSPEEYVRERKKKREELRKTLDQDLIRSINEGYLIKFRGMEL